jgi:ribosomal protein S18 acetylase RimI-like enzyme
VSGFDRARFALELFGAVDERTRVAELIGEAELAFAIECVLEPVRTRNPATRANETLMRKVLDGSRERGDVLALAWQGEQCVGFVWTSANGPSDHTEIYLNELSLVPAMRGAGLGATLLARLEHAARLAGARAIDLDFMADNPRVRSLYERAGFTQVGVEVIGTRPEGRTVDGVSAPTQSELAAVVSHAVRMRSLCTFARPWMSRDDVEAEVASVHAQQRILVARRDGELVGLAIWRCVPSIVFGDVVCALEVLEAPPDLARVMVQALCATLPREAAARIVVTVREPSEAEVATLIALGLSVHRYKCRKALAADDA